jgi:hypothetical protein
MKIPGHPQLWLQSDIDGVLCSGEHVNERIYAFELTGVE